MMLVRISLCLAVAVMLSGCGDRERLPPSTPVPPPPTGPTPIVECSGALPITINRSSSLGPIPRAEGMVWTSYFQATLLTAQPAVFIVDLFFEPDGCVAPWTAVSEDTSAVQLSPKSGNGRAQVELFMPLNNGARRTTLVTIAGQTASITQSGR
jgi:hypothetical protein